MKAIFEVEFDSGIMYDKKALKKECNNSWFIAMKRLYKSDGIGIFDRELKLKKIVRG